MLVALPVLGPRFGSKEGFFKAPKWEIAFLVAVPIFLISGIWKVTTKQDEILKSSNDVKLILEKIEKEASRLNVSDFQIKLSTSVRNSDIDLDEKNLTPIYIEGSLGKVHMSFEFVYNQDRQMELQSFGKGGMGMVSEYIYYARNINIGGLEKYPYLKDLDQKVMHFQIPPGSYSNRYLPKNGSVELFIKGRRFKGRIDHEKNVEITISMINEKEQNN